MSAVMNSHDYVLMRQMCSIWLLILIGYMYLSGMWYDAALRTYSQEPYIYIYNAFYHVAMQDSKWTCHHPMDGEYHGLWPKCNPNFNHNVFLGKLSTFKCSLHPGLGVNHPLSKGPTNNYPNYSQQNSSRRGIVSTNLRQYTCLE